METIESREVANLCKSGIKGYNEMNGRIYDTDGVCPTIRANSGGHNEIKIAIPQATKQGYIECELGGGDRHELPEQQDTSWSSSRGRHC